MEPTRLSPLLVTQSSSVNHFIEQLQLMYQSDLEEVILFGSHARHQATDASDIDILVVLDRDTVRPFAELARIGEILSEIMIRYQELLAPVVVSVQDWHRPTRNPLLQQISQEGLSLWKRPSDNT